MRRLRWSIIALVLHLALFFNLERLDFGAENVIDIQSFVYILGTLLVIAIIGWQVLRGRTPALLITGSLALYAVLRLLIFNQRPLLGGLNLYLTITEMVMIGICVFLAQRVAFDLQDFEQAVINITLPQTNHRVRRLREAQEDIQTEMLRSRRHQRPLSVTILRPEAGSMDAVLHRSVRDIQQAMIGRYVLNSLMRIVADLMRRTDTVLEVPQGDEIIVVSPETTAEQSIILTERVKAMAVQQLGITLISGTAAFPQDALTFEELVRSAKRVAGQAAPAVPDPGKEPPIDGIDT